MPTRCLPRTYLFALLGTCFGTGVYAQGGFSRADSGWVPIFNGTNFDGLYSRMYEKEITETVDPAFSINNKEIHVAFNAGGHLATKKVYSHYQVRVDYKYGQKIVGVGNAGLLYHVDDSHPRMGDKHPRSVEDQMKKPEAGWFYSIQQVTVDIPVANNCKNCYEPGSSKMGVSPRDGRFFTSGNTPDPYKDNDWNVKITTIRGADSGKHVVNGITRMEVYNYRVPAGTGKFTPYGEGRLGVQAEGSEVMYRNWEIMEIHPKSPVSYFTRFFLDQPRTAQSVIPGATVDIKWRSIGPMKNAKIEYHAQGNWNNIAASAPNNGSYAWQVPAGLTGAVKLRISGVAGEEWVASDESEALPTSIGNLKMPASHRLMVKGKDQWVSWGKPWSSVNIRDAKGTLIKTFGPENNGSNITWDLSDNTGQQVRGGIYFITFSQDRQKQTFKVWVTPL